MPRTPTAAERSATGASGNTPGVRFLRRRAHHRPAPATWVIRQERAYTLLEEARLLCEDLRGHGEEADPGDVMNAVHRELGLAGFFASSNLRSARRHELLADARRRARDHRVTPKAMFGALHGLTQLGRDAVERALGAEVLSDHMHVAHVHLLSAQELLRAAHGEERLRLAARPATSARH